MGFRWHSVIDMLLNTIRVSWRHRGHDDNNDDRCTMKDSILRVDEWKRQGDGPGNGITEQLRSVGTWNRIQRWQLGCSVNAHCKWIYKLASNVNTAMNYQIVWVALVTCTMCWHNVCLSVCMFGYFPTYSMTAWICRPPENDIPIPLNCIVNHVLREASFFFLHFLLLYYKLVSKGISGSLHRDTVGVVDVLS